MNVNEFVLEAPNLHTQNKPFEKEGIIQKKVLMSSINCRTFRVISVSLVFFPAFTCFSVPIERFGPDSQQSIEAMRVD